MFLALFSALPHPRSLRCTAFNPASADRVPRVVNTRRGCWKKMPKWATGNNPPADVEPPSSQRSLTGNPPHDSFYSQLTPWSMKLIPAPGPFDCLRYKGCLRCSVEFSRSDGDICWVICWSDVSESEWEAVGAKAENWAFSFAFSAVLKQSVLFLFSFFTSSW